MKAELREFGPCYPGYGTREKHCAVGVALLDMLAGTTGDEITPATKAARTGFSGSFAEAISRGSRGAKSERFS